MAGKNEKINGPKVDRRPLEAPSRKRDAVSMLAEATMLFAYTERRYLLNLPRAIARAVWDKDKTKTIASECGGERSDCVRLKATGVDLKELEKLLRWSMSIKSKEWFSVVTGFPTEDILLWTKRKAGILKPVFIVVRDKQSKCLLVFIRGTHSIKDILTDALCAPVSFDHDPICSSSTDGGSKVSGYAHRGMDAAADWILKECLLILLKAHRQNPDFNTKIVGHSLGGGTAALLTFKLREIQQFSSTTCVTFGPAACVTKELAEFAKPFITSIINGSDIVPTLSASSVHDFISESRSRNDVRSSFLKDLARRAKFGFTEAVVKRMFSWLRRENVDTSSSSKSDNVAEASGSSETSFKSLLKEEKLIKESILDDDEHNSSSEGSDDDEDELSNHVKKEKEAAATETKKTAEGERRHLYPPGRIMHMIDSAAHSSENPNNPNHNDEKHVFLYETPTHLYGKVRLVSGMILDHPKKKYQKTLQKLINQ